MYKVITKWKKPVLNHALGFCRVCNLEFDIFHNGKSEFMEHARKTGHNMEIETTYYQHYIKKEQQ